MLSRDYHVCNTTGPLVDGRAPDIFFFAQGQRHLDYPTIDGHASGK
jgi:hypothetical protein